MVGTLCERAAPHRRGPGRLISPSPAVEHAHGLALAARHLAGGQDLDGDADADMRVQRPAGTRGQGIAVGSGVDGLAADRDLIEVAWALDDELVVRGDARLGEQLVPDHRRVWRIV